MRSLIAVLSLVYSSVALAGSTYVAIGDSITSGLNSQWLAPLGKYSFATGWGLERSFASFVAADNYYNVALPGALSGYIQYQAEFAHHVQAKYVTIDIGSNDICWVDPAKIVPTIDGMVRQLSAYSHTEKILVASLPDFRQLYQLRRGSLSCKIPKLICASYFNGDDEYRAKIDNDILSINRSLQKMQVMYSKVVYVDIARDSYSAEDISTVDCFHPSAKGQQRISDKFVEAFLNSDKKGSEE